jgi:hypothetical protein
MAAAIFYDRLALASYARVGVKRHLAWVTSHGLAALTEAGPARVLAPGIPHGFLFIGLVSRGGESGLRVRGSHSVTMSAWVPSSGWSSRSKKTVRASEQDRPDLPAGPDVARDTRSLLCTGLK